MQRHPVIRRDEDARPLRTGFQLKYCESRVKIWHKRSPR
jgi:hypothetical protein